MKNIKSDDNYNIYCHFRVSTDKQYIINNKGEIFRKKMWYLGRPKWKMILDSKYDLIIKLHNDNIKFKALVKKYNCSDKTIGELLNKKLLSDKFTTNQMFCLFICYLLYLKYYFYNNIYIY